MIPYACEAIERAGGRLDVGEIFKASQWPVSRLLEERGMNESLFELLWRAPDEAGRPLEGLAVTCREKGVLQLEGTDIQTSLQARNPNPLPLLDGDTWVYAGALRLLGLDPEMEARAPLTSPWGSTLSLAKTIVDSYEYRAREAARSGLKVRDTGIFWFIIVAIVIAVVLIVAGIVIMVECGLGNITNKDVCTLGVALIFIGGLILCFALGGEADPASGTICQVVITLGADG